MTGPKYALTAKQTSDNRWYFDVTVHSDDQTMEAKLTPKGTPIRLPLGRVALVLVEQAEQDFRNRGRLLVSDPKVGAVT